MTEQRGIPFFHSLRTGHALRLGTERLSRPLPADSTGPAIGGRWRARSTPHRDSPVPTWRIAPFRPETALNWRGGCLGLAADVVLFVMKTTEPTRNLSRNCSGNGIR